MKKLFLLIPVLAIATTFVCATPTITIDGDKSDWAEVPMLSEPAVWPMLKVMPAADASMGTNALSFMMENKEDFDPTWEKYPTEFIDKDYNKSTETIDEYWAFPAMGIDYKATTGVDNGGWISFPKAMSADNKVFEIGFPATYITDLGSKFGFAMYYNSGAWFCPDYSSPAVNPSNGFLYKTRTYSTLPCTLTTANVYAHQSMGEVGDYVDFGLRDNGNDTARWAAFPVILEKQGYYTITTNVSSTNGWKFEFWLVDVASNAVVAHIDPPASDVSSEKTSYTFGTLDLTSVPVGKYMLKVKNRTRYSKVKLNNVEVAYAGGAMTDIPATLQPVDAIRSERAFVNNDGEFRFTDDSHDGYVTSQWGKWNIHVTKAGFYTFTFNAKSDNSHHYKLYVLNTDETQVAEYTLDGSSGKELTTTTSKLQLAANDYIIKVTNTTNHSHGRVIKIIANYVGGATIDIPANTLTGQDAVLVADENKLRLIDGNLVSHNDDATNTDYAWWKVRATQTGTVNVNLTILSGTEIGHSYTVGLYTDLEDDPVQEVSEAVSGSWSTGEKTLGTFNVTKDNTYYVKVLNSLDWSEAILGGIRLSYPIPAIDEEEYYESEVIVPYHGKTGDVQLNRSLTGGMYNTICLPFAVSAAEMARVFPGAIVKELTSSSIEEGGFVLNLNFDAVDEMEAGVPYIIKPASNISNPKFLGVTIDKTLNNTETANADFIGNFVVDEIVASEDNLFLGSNNTLYFPTVDMEIKGLRAYFVVTNNPYGAPIRRARIVEQGNVATEIEIAQPDMLDKAVATGVIKRIENGQLLIIREGVQYNALGVRVK